MLKRIIIAICCLFFLPLVFEIQKKIDNFKKENNIIIEEIAAYNFSGKYLKIALLEHKQLGADLLWLRTVQYIGDIEKEKQKYPRLYYLIDTVTDLDPKFDYPYQVGGVILSSIGGRLKESNAILEKGIKENPTIWQMPFYLGFNHFFYLDDYKKAAEYIQKASELPKSPKYLPFLAARLYAQAKNPDTALDFLYKIYENTEQEQMKKAIEKRIKEVIVEKDIHLLEKALDTYYRKYGLYPEQLDLLVKKGIINNIPSEPFGGYYYFDWSKKEIRSSANPEKLRVYK